MFNYGKNVCLCESDWNKLSISPNVKVVSSTV